MTVRQTVCIAAALVACAVTTQRPSAQAYGSCGYIWVGGNDAGDYLYGWANLVIYNPNCSYEYGVEAGVAVQVVSPWGTSDFASEGGGEWQTDGFVDTFVPLDPAESGFGSVTGWGAISYYGFPIDYLYDSLTVFVPPPAGGGDPPGEDPPPPTITFSPGNFVTRDYDSGDVIITANVDPPGQGWEQQIYWVGDGQETGNPQERRFSTSGGVGTFSATAVIASETEATASVKVIPVLVLWPPEQTATQHPTLYLPYSAQVFPEGAATVEWTGAGWTHPETSLIRYINRDVVGTHVAYARAGESQQQQVVANVVPNLELRLVLDVNNDFNPGALSDDSPTFVPGANLDGSSRPVSEMSSTGQMVRLIAYYVDAAMPNQIASAPAGSSATFYLENTSAWNGYAMNAGQGTAPDFVFPATQAEQESSTRSVPFGDGNIAVVEMRVRDYGGRTQVRATSSTNLQTTPFSLPRDNGNNNGIADGGWRAYGHQGHPAQLATDCTTANCQWQEDIDGTPTGTGPPSYGTVGDGLAVWEEYRGFVVRGTHVRTHPSYKDLFVSSNVTASNLNESEALQYARDNLRANSATMTEIGVRLHHVWGQDDPNIPAGEFIEYKIDPQLTNPHHAEQRRINFNEPLSSPIALNPQKAIRIRISPQPLAMGTVGLWDGNCYTPAGPQSGGGVPYTTKEALIDVSQHQGNHHEIKRTVAHEIGHAINILHRGGGTPDACPDGATVQNVTSVMSPWQPNGSGSVSSPSAQFHASDVVQIRIRWHP